MEEKKKKGRRRNKKKGANGISGPQALFCTAAQHATTQLLESTSCCARWCREKGARRSDRRVCKGGRADSFPPPPYQSIDFFFFFFFFPIVVVAPKEARASPLSFDAAAASSSHGDGIRTATISGSQWETELPMTVLL